MTETVSATVSDDQKEFIEEEGLSQSTLLQKAIERERQKRKEGYGQISVSQERSKLTVNLRNYPIPVDSKKPEDSQYPIPLYKAPEGELVDTPPIEKTVRDEDVAVIKREDTEEICGFEVGNWEEHYNVSLIFGEEAEEPYVVVDPPVM